MSENNAISEKIGFFNKIRNVRIVKLIDKFLRSPYFLLVLAVYSVVTNVFATEVYSYSFIVFSAIYVAIFCDDLLPILPMFVFSYLSPSGGNNPGVNKTSVFSMSGSGKYFIIIIAILVVTLLIRLIFDKEIGFSSIKKKKFALLKGICFVTISFLISGIFSTGYMAIAKKNIIFVLLELASLFLLYFLFSFAVKWDNVKANYFCIIGALVAVVTVIELANVYRVGKVIDANNVANKALISTGWGKSNNLGAMLAMTLPCLFLFACQKKLGFLVLPIAEIVLVATFFTLSRASIIFAVLAFLFGCAFVCLHKQNRLRNIITVAVMLISSIVLAVILKDKLLKILQDSIKKGLDDSGRFELYRGGFQKFIEAPVFGHSFYLPDFATRYWENAELSSILPPFMHNTIIQILASCGVVGIFAYAFHRFETVKIFVKNFSLENMFVAVSLLGLVLMSLLDCHIFNLGPGLYYATALAFGENVVSGEKFSFKNRQKQQNSETQEINQNDILETK